MKSQLTLFILLFVFICQAKSELESNCQLYPPPLDFFDWLSEIIEEPEKFGPKSSVFQLGIGFVSDVNLANRVQELDQLDVKMITPALSITYERNVWNNVGVGITLANQIWRVPVFNYQYRYYSGGIRATYHFNILDKLDPYVGGSVSFRFLSLTNKQENIHHSKVSGSWVIGARYYLTERFGGFFEAGDDALSWFKIGLTYYIP